MPCNCSSEPVYCNIEGCSYPTEPHCRYCARPLPVIEVIPSVAPMVPSGIEVISGAPMGAPTLKGNSMLSKLIDARDEAQSAISEINDKIEELQNAVEELENFETSVTDLIDTLENVDGTSVDVSVDAIDLSLSIDL